MRYRALLLMILVLFLSVPAAAQDSEYPTLDALANFDVPAFDYAEMVGRMSSTNPNHEPPANPPQYEIGDRDWFNLSVGADRDIERLEMELRAKTDRVLIWVQTTVVYQNWRAQQLARDIETVVLNPMQKLFQFSEPPGVDGDPRLTVAMIHDPEGKRLGYFSASYARPRSLYSTSNEREMLVANLARDDDYTFYDEVLMEIIAHEYLHILQFHIDISEELWLDEAVASYAGHLIAEKYFSVHNTHGAGDIFLEAPDNGLTQWQTVEEKGPKYGAGVLFMIFLAERFGEDIIARLLVEKADGWQAVSKVLREHAGVSADDVFADWVLANYFLDSRRGYGYRGLEDDLEPPQPVAGLNSFPATYEGELPQYATDYITVDVRGADKLFVRLWQAPEARLFEAFTGEDASFVYAVSSDFTHARLTRAFNLDTSRQVWLEYRFWYDLAEENEYLYVTASTDNGESWQTLRGKYTDLSERHDQYFTHGYTGTARFWLHERIDLSRFAPGELLISFELVANFGASYRGVALDSVRIGAIDYKESFASLADGWSADGWILTDNRLPNNTWLQVVQDTGSGLHLSRALVSGNGDMTVDLLPGVTQALVAVSPVVPLTGLPTEYELEAYLLNAAGEVMVVARECSVATTTALNFRNAPNGNKIGLLPEGTTVDALDRQEDWFQVDYNGVVGWVHADYVTTHGKCDYE